MAAALQCAMDAIGGAILTLPTPMARTRNPGKRDVKANTNFLATDRM